MYLVSAVLVLWLAGGLYATLRSMEPPQGCTAIIALGGAIAGVAMMLAAAATGGVGAFLTARRSVALALAVIPLGLAACGDDDAEQGTGAKEPAAPAATPPAASALAITTSDAGPERFSTKAPKSIKGGLVKLTFTNAGKDDHEAQLVRIGDHTPEEAVKIYGAEEGPVPEWLRFAGGASAGPGQTVTSAMNLEPGKYAMLDNAAFMGPVNSELGALATFEVTAGTPGSCRRARRRSPPSTTRKVSPSTSTRSRG